MNFHESQTYLESFINYELSLKDTSFANFRLDRVKELLRLLDSPQQYFKIIHVTGSKGKGSTSTMIASILREAGYRVGLYTSPHLDEYRERIRILDKRFSSKNTRDEDIFSDMISEEDFAKGLSSIKSIVEIVRSRAELGILSFFEVFTAFALHYFAKQRVDFVILEVGLGGRLDATNAVETLMSVITPISLEHTRLLGDTVEQIAKEKSAIIKQGQLCSVIASQSLGVRKVLESRCCDAQVKSSFVDDNTKIRFLRYDGYKYQIFDLETKNNMYKQLKTPLLGPHQLINASVAINVVESLQSVYSQISREAIYKGIENVFWPGRFEVIKQQPLIILDGAHNEDSTKVLLKTLREVFPNKKYHLVWGVSEDKKKEDMATLLNDVVDDVVTTQSDHRRAYQFLSQESACLFSGKKVVNTKSVLEALIEVNKLTKKDEAILITGSLYLVSEARRLILKGVLADVSV